MTLEWWQLPGCRCADLLALATAFLFYAWYAARNMNAEQKERHFDDRRYRGGAAL